MELALAKKTADRIADWLRPFCERIEIAGSIRRQRAICNDVDLVIIPKVEVVKDMFGVTLSTRNVLHDFLIRYVADSKGRTFWIKGQDNNDGKNFSLKSPLCQLDLWMATPQTYGSRLLCRTGSIAHNVWLIEWAKALGCVWEPYWGLRLDGELPFGETEEGIYARLGLGFIDPTHRDPDTNPVLGYVQQVTQGHPYTYA